MKVTLFGATGKTGKYLIAEGLRRGIDLTVFARSGSSFKHNDVRIVQGDLTDKSLLRSAIHGADAVLSALGPTSLKHPKDRPVTQANVAITSAMTEEHVTRFIAISTGTAVDPCDEFDWKIWLPAQLIRFAMPSAYRDIIGLARAVRASKTDWTMVRVAFLKDLPASHRLNVGLYGITKHSLVVSREDLARFMFEQIGDHAYLRQAPGISAQVA